MRLTNGRRDPFPDCRHRGFGKFCHRCAQARAAQEQAAKLDMKKDAARIAELRTQAEKLLKPTEKKVTVSLNG